VKKDDRGALEKKRIGVGVLDTFLPSQGSGIRGRRNRVCIMRSREREEIIRKPNETNTTPWRSLLPIFKGYSVDLMPEKGRSCKSGHESSTLRGNVG